MSYNEHFETLLSNIANDQIIGIGNPNAKILFIGKEPGIEIGKESYHGSLKSWQDRIHNYSNKYVPSEMNLRNLNHTWQRYQKLYDQIIEKTTIKSNGDKNDKYEITFIENVFTTELSNLHAPNTKEAKKQANFTSELKRRKEEYFNSSFIDNFPIILIFASDNNYIETYPGEVCEMFKVKFDSLYEYPGKDKIWIHYSENKDKPKLVIHTRQLTNRISPDLIASLSDIISNFMHNYSIDVIVK